MKILNGLWMVVIALLVGACDDMLDNIRPYLDKGETVYVGKVDSLYTHVGCNRIELVARLKSGFTQTKCQVAVTDPDGVKDTLYYEVERQNGEQYLKYMYNELKEGQYDFSMIMYDALGNKSLPVLASGYSYGSFYQSTLFNRRLTRVQERDGNIVLCWKSIDSALYTLVTYVTDKGEEKTVKVPTSEYETVIEDYASGTPFSWVTVYKPRETALDEFYSSPDEEIFPALDELLY